MELHLYLSLEHHIDAARELVTIGASLNVTELNACTPLYEALVKGETAFGYFQLKRGVRIYESKSGFLVGKENNCSQ